MSTLDTGLRRYGERRNATGSTSFGAVCSRMNQYLTFTRYALGNGGVDRRAGVRVMMRTKWMRLGVRDPADILRWASAQDTRQLDDFRYRVIHGREFVSFRMVPRYRVQIGTSDIIVVAHVKPSLRQSLFTAATMLARKTVAQVSAAIAAFRPRAVIPAPLQTAELFEFAPLRVSSHR
jgi:hypothetical protein